MTVYDYMSMMIRECKEYVENFKMKRKVSCLPEIPAVVRRFEQLHRERTDPQVLFRGLSDSDGYVRHILAGSRFNGGDDDEAKDRASYILDCDLLIIDDLGTELINTFTASQMFYCVNERLNRNKGTIISTNLTLGNSGCIHGARDIKDHEPV